MGCIMGQKVTGFTEAKFAKALLDQAIMALDSAGLQLIAAKAEEARERLDDWLAMSLVDFVGSPEFLGSDPTPSNVIPMVRARNKRLPERF